MPRVLQQFVQPVQPCSYLHDRDAALDVQLMLEVTPAELEALLERGWRRFGPSYFRPLCTHCGECVPIRIPTRTFLPSRSQRRADRLCADLRVQVGSPRVDRERLALYHRWHQDREAERGWDRAPLDARSYQIEFAFPHPSAREMAWYRTQPDGTEQLVAIGICDETPSAWSAAYFFYDPTIAKRSPGVANVVRQVCLARERGLDHVYLGFRVMPCPSMRYKSGFHPHELLQGRPGADETPNWIAAL